MGFYRDDMTCCAWIMCVWILICGILGDVMPQTAAADAVLPARPNFIIILADDMGYGDTSANGGWIRTPCLDRMAKEGLRFTDFHSSGVVCSPSRAGLLTGCYQQRVGVPGVINADPKLPAHRWGLKAGTVTFSRLLKESGYRTAVFGKWHLGYAKKFNPVHHGFDEFRGYVSGNVDYVSHYDRMGTYDWWHNLAHVKEPGYVTHLITQHSVRFIKENRDKPFCLYVSHEAVHTPFQAPGDAAQRGPEGKRRKMSAQEKKETYRKMMVALDDSVGAILDAVGQAGVSRRTLVIFMSDNGAAPVGSNGPLRGHKGTEWEGGHRVPAIAWWPGTVKPGATTDQLTMMFDVMPTLLSLAKVPLPENHKLDGVGFESLLKSGKKSTKESTAARRLVWNGKAMRDGPWKLMMNKGKPQLFNLDDDIGESRNVAKDQPKRVKAMEAYLKKWAEEVGA